MRLMRDWFNSTFLTVVPVTQLAVYLVHPPPPDGSTSFTLCAPVHNTHQGHHHTGFHPRKVVSFWGVLQAFQSQVRSVRVCATIVSAYRVVRSV